MAAKPNPFKKAPAGKSPPKGKMPPEKAPGKGNPFGKQKAPPFKKAR